MNTKQHITENLKEASIVVVDDEPINLKLMQKMLAVEGYCNVTCTDDPRAVTALCEEKSCDLLLLDLNMPQVSGYEVLKDVMAMDMGAPSVLVVSAQSDRQHRVRALNSGARDYLTKPYERSELSARIRNLLETRLQQNFIQRSNELLERKVEERTHELHHTRLQVVRRLGRAAEYRDNETGNHIIRMSKVSALLGRAYGMNEHQCDLLLNASPMHDIGKIGIPDHILLKAGKLDADEWEVMKTHTLIGADILSGDDSELLVMAKEIALSHHERWDGQGYPYNLGEEDIPLTGRIVALADVYDALTSHRPYKQAWTPDDATDRLQSDSGKHFDPDLVVCFMDNLAEIEEIRQQLQDESGNQGSHGKIERA